MAPIACSLWLFLYIIRTAISNTIFDWNHRLLALAKRPTCVSHIIAYDSSTKRGNIARFLLDTYQFTYTDTPVPRLFRNQRFLCAAPDGTVQQSTYVQYPPLVLHLVFVAPHSMAGAVEVSKHVSSWAFRFMLLISSPRFEHSIQNHTAGSSRRNFGAVSAT